MFYLLAIFLIGCAAVGHLIAHAGTSVWGLLPFIIFGAVALQLGWAVSSFLQS